jgi:hypothetical protein
LNEKGENLVNNQLRKKHLAIAGCFCDKKERHPFG